MTDLRTALEGALYVNDKLGTKAMPTIGITFESPEAAERFFLIVDPVVLSVAEEGDRAALAQSDGWQPIEMLDIANDGQPGWAYYGNSAHIELRTRWREQDANYWQPGVHRAPEIPTHFFPCPTPTAPEVKP